jgi:hypothetical protein
MVVRTDFRDFTGALYEVISAPAGERNWDRVRPLYHTAARMVRTGVNDDASPIARVMSLDDYIDNVEELLTGVAFRETELSHDARIFGNVAQLASVYEFHWHSRTGKREGRGVNFFTLIFDGDRWQIMSIVWDNERKGISLDESGLSKFDL